MELASMSGKQTVQMDQRGRISFPAAYRAVIGNTLYITPDQGERGYLIVRSQEGYDAELKRIKEDCLARGCDSEDTHDEMFDFASRTVSTPTDKNGRVTLDADLVKYAELSHERKVVVVGVGDYAVLWDEDRLAEHDRQREELRARRRAKKDRDKAAALAALSAEEA